MAKEFDIYLRKRLHECDLIVTSLAYRDGLTITSRLLLESCIKEYTLQKTVAANTDIELVAHIDEMLETIYATLHQSNVGSLLNYLETRDGKALCTRDGEEIVTVYKFPSFGVGLKANAHISGRKYGGTDGSGVELCITDELPATLIQYFRGEVGIEFGQSDLTALVRKFTGYVNSNMELSQAIYQTLVYAFEQFESAMSMDAVVTGEQGTKYLDADSAMELVSNLKNLCYRYYNSGKTDVELAAIVIATELHYSLGKGFSNIVLGSDITKGVLYKIEAPQNAVELATNATGYVTQFVTFDEVAVQIVANAEMILKRHRLLYEMDENSLSSMDDMTLEELDYVIIA